MKKLIKIGRKFLEIDIFVLYSPIIIFCLFIILYHFTNINISDNSGILSWFVLSSDNYFSGNGSFNYSDIVSFFVHVLFHKDMGHYLYNVIFFLIGYHILQYDELFTEKNLWVIFLLGILVSNMTFFFFDMYTADTNYVVGMSGVSYLFFVLGSLQSVRMFLLNKEYFRSFSSLIIFFVFVILGQYDYILNVIQGNNTLYEAQNNVFWQSHCTNIVLGIIILSTITLINKRYYKIKY